MTGAIRSVLGSEKSKLCFTNGHGEMSPDDVTWTQEEPRNMGAWDFVHTRFEDLKVNARYVGRNAAASPATGSLRRHVAEQQAIIDESFG